MLLIPLFTPPKLLISHCQDHLSFTMFAPVVLAGAILLGFLALPYLKAVRALDRRWFRRGRPKDMLLAALPWLLLLTFLVSPVVSSSAFRAFSCEEFDNGYFTPEVNLTLTPAHTLPAPRSAPATCPVTWTLHSAPCSTGEAISVPITQSSAPTRTRGAATSAWSCSHGSASCYTLWASQCSIRFYSSPLAARFWTTSPPP